MKNSIDETLVKITADMCIFLEFSDGSTLNQDAAISMLEQISGELQSLESDRAKEIVEIFKLIGKKYQTKKYEEFVLVLPETLGLHW